MPPTVSHLSSPHSRCKRGTTPSRHSPQECPLGPHSERTFASGPASPGPGCGNWGSRSSASTPPRRVTRGSRTWRWWASSRSPPPVPAGRLPAEQHRAFTHLPGLPSWGRGPGRQARPPTYLLHAHLLRHHDDAAVALHRGCQGQPDPWRRHGETLPVHLQPMERALHDSPKPHCPLCPQG